MKNIYYQLWVDGIVNSTSYKKKEHGWQSQVFWIITIANSLNMAVIILWLEAINLQIYKFEINLFANSLLENIIEGFINFCVPFSALNYLLIFYKKRYIKLIKKYDHFNGKYALIYTLLSIILLLFTMIALW